MSRLQIGISFPSDPEGFLRRECPRCERAFKAQLTGIDQQPNYRCPYCREEAPANEWFTQAQLKYIQERAAEKVLDPLLHKMDESFKRMARSSGGMLKVRSGGTRPQAARKPIELNDMARVETPCHPENPIKAQDSWTGALACFMCGTEVRADPNRPASP